MEIDVALVSALVAEQFPEWSDRPVVPVERGGWDNRTFRLGDDLSVRLPSAAHYVPQIEKEQRWLPLLARHLPLPIPAPAALGRPNDSFPFPWSVYRWIRGHEASSAPLVDGVGIAADLAAFLAALQQIDTTGAPEPGEHNFFRGGSLTVYDAQAREAIAALAGTGTFDADAAEAVWDAALAAKWTGPPVWFHGDVSTGNLLVDDLGALSAVIDFGGMGVGDPACDLVIAWQLFDDESREIFRRLVPGDDGVWARARGWSLWKAMIVAAGFSGTVSPPPGRSRMVIERVLDDHHRYA
ncbi:MAG: PhnO protein [Frondihabitans sp.]|nr:PhnO protein [Frondihabitans sp.]